METTKDSTLKLICEWCHEQFAPYRNNPKQRFCNRSCSSKHRTRNGQTPAVKASLLAWSRSEENKQRAREQLRILREDPKHREWVTNRMTHHNPGADPEVAKKAQATKQARGYTYEHLNGGNGRGPTEAEASLLGALGGGWESSYVVVTRAGRGSGYPSHYKLDLALPCEMLYIECDGHSHLGTKARDRDAKKAEFLSERGWTLLRFWNREILNDLEGCVEKVNQKLSQLSTT